VNGEEALEALEELDVLGVFTFLPYSDD